MRALSSFAPFRYIVRRCETDTKQALCDVKLVNEDVCAVKGFLTYITFCGKDWRYNTQSGIFSRALGASLPQSLVEAEDAD
eukprot:scaffold5357_cov208-Amphora_coffeaeformis.AAC.6